MSQLSPFVEFRSDLDVHRRALEAGLSDQQYVDLVGELDVKVESVAGTGFRTTPLVRLELPPEPATTTTPATSGRAVWAKVETANVAGSHKARHLFGLLLFDEIAHRTSWLGAGRPTLAIASCGNAALAAAVVARAVDRSLDVFVPVDADPLIVARLDELGASVVSCERRPGELGDPCVARLEDAVSHGAQPFTVQGTTCPDAFDGGRTLGLELARQLSAVAIDEFDLYLQIGGGAMAVATMDGLVRARGTGVAVSPRLHPVQAEVAHPYVAAWRRIEPELRAVDRAAWSSIIDDADVMTPWPVPPVSVASGILDDITYDWRPLMQHQVRSGGWPVLVSEEQFKRAASVAASVVSPPPDATGAAGLAGALFDDETATSMLDAAVVVLSGVDRAYEASGRPNSF